MKNAIQTFVYPAANMPVFESNWELLTSKSIMEYRDRDDVHYSQTLTFHGKYILSFLC